MFSAACIKDETAAINMLKLFMEMGVNPNSIDALLQTPIFYAAKGGAANVCEFLAQNGCSVNQLDCYG